MVARIAEEETGTAEMAETAVGIVAGIAEEKTGTAEIPEEKNTALACWSAAGSRTTWLVCVCVCVQCHGACLFFWLSNNYNYKIQ